MPYKIYDIELNDNDKSEEAIQAILYQHQRAINELIDEMKKLNPNFNPISDIVMYLGLTQDEEYILLQNLSLSKKTITEKRNWLNKWLKDNIFECPEEYVNKIIYTFTSIEDIK